MEKTTRVPVVSKKVLLPFILITSLFALWAFANDITNPMVAAFATVMEISNAKAALIQFAFYGGYATMAIPAALFVRKHSYKKGILLGLGLYAFGALLFYPAAKYEIFEFFLISLYILTFGLAFLETTANPYILSMGDERTATQRLNLAQAFNPIGSLLGMFVASKFILTFLESDKRNEFGELIFTNLDEAQKMVIRTHDLEVIRNPYLILGFVVIAMFLVITLLKMPEQAKNQITGSAYDSFKRLIKNGKYREGVIAQLFYVAAQIMCWTFIIQYAENLGITKAEAQNYNIIAMALFLISRFICTFLMKYVSSRILLTTFAFGGMITTFCVVFVGGILGLYFLVATSFFMSLMFPTIYGIALHGLKEEDTTLGAAGLVMAIVGGAIMPILQGLIIDFKTIGNYSAVNISFLLPFSCFFIIAIYGYRTLKVYN
ncbi:L-fucose:H+ symporter permease [Flavobacterium fluviatile]|uniref:L-fucose:H+ symporter permease n=1 Tax=Flavobacterium fluviatile TaxID=1862387 RepID=UPI0013D3EC36|nr:L-fucose:H+ symporter permease [Flavobacterium fluviatile]